MFLSDKLLEIGLKANPKNNMSMAKQARKMRNEIESALDAETITKSTAIGVTKHICSKLNKEGYSFYRFEVFFEKR